VLLLLPMPRKQKPPRKTKRKSKIFYRIKIPPPIYGGGIFCFFETMQIAHQ
jgi:Na+/glutamate symporter